MPLTKATFLLCVGAAVANTALASSTMLAAQASRVCFSGAAFNRTWFGTATAVLPARATVLLCVGAAVAGTALASCPMFAAHTAFPDCVGAAVADTALA